ncbi:malectin domain-containing carbohydrate-binding protein [Pedobacter sp. SYSU D00535]|uniref:malectin domain-containing carbohydrate-binding protein n=1 Tax=Pedobacter sp. SYSU D00535 TaxID=2810308 RepID=UPI001A96C9A0|nr:malectin domain-containing carbohydrate-binding protein [Pedobacter sp. SYSU D00535]
MIVTKRTIYLLAFICGINLSAFGQAGIRKDISLDNGWRSIANDEDKEAYKGFEKTSFNDKNWEQVNVPHNWDQYHGYRRLMHGNRHGYSWYRKTFTTADKKPGSRYFLWFEGVGSYATVFLNGKQVGYHAGGRTSFTLDVTDAINLNNKPNLLAVRADHPPHIQDLPWVCGGCSTERGFSEGSQPMGIFRPVHLIVTNEVRIEPFGVHVWNDASVNEKSALLNHSTELKNYGKSIKNLRIVTTVNDRAGKKVAESSEELKIAAGSTVTTKGKLTVTNPTLWSVENPYLYDIHTKVYEQGKLLDELNTAYGIRWISWPIGRKNNDKRFFLNGKPVFINGIAEYEHLIGNSHAFSAEQVSSRVRQMKAAGFNSFRDAHQPHNFRYHEFWDKEGILWWTQMAAHIWYDTPEFRKNFKELLTDWVKERRNSPSIILWGLENESTLPEDFARECTELIRKLDPTASSQRLVTTCNGGSGTDWDVPQNWTGTYGGDPKTYDQDVQRQVLIGEYGAWRTLDLHTEGPFNQNGPYSEDRMSQLMEMKVRLAESVKDKTSGHYFWLFTSHDNPGRVQGGEGLRELDRIGPVNYKGLLTPWEEPLDVFYMFRANYAPKETEPMVYIVSHTWPERWLSPGRKDSITIYSNCDEVELFNDVNKVSLGRKKRGGIGTHFQWDNVDIRYNVLYAKGYVKGKEVATDYIVLHHLPQAPSFNDFYKNAKNITAPEKGLNYLYRVNAGGPDYKDENGNIWMADRHRSSDKTWGSVSWTDDFAEMPPYFASQRHTHDPIKGTKDWKLFQNFRYGRDKLKYFFPVPDGEYVVELYFTEPWLGTGGGMDATGMRVFDVAVNGQTVLDDVDIWKEAGHDAALKKTVKVKVKGGQLVLSFPEVKSGQALISAIAIASTKDKIQPAPASPLLIENQGGKLKTRSWMDTGNPVYADNQQEVFVALPSYLHGAEYIQNTATSNSSVPSFKVSFDADVYIALAAKAASAPIWMKDYEEQPGEVVTTANGGERFKVFRKRFKAGETVQAGAVAGKAIVAVNPASNIQPAYDLKKATSYKATEAVFKGTGLTKEVLMGRERVVFKRASGDVLEFTFSTGVADTYSLTLKYHNPFQKDLKGKIEILAADGTVMKKAEDVVFAPTKEGKWNYFNTNTGTMINAGTYKVRIIADDAANLAIDALDVQ